MIQIKSAPQYLVARLEAVEDALVAYTEKQSPLIREGLKSLVKGGGKRIRPLLCLMGIYYGDGQTRPPEKVVELATMPELLHLASLIHDDIIDQADARRGVETLHKRFGTHVAVYSGDLVIIETLHRMLDFFERDDYRRFSKDLLALVQSEILQMTGKQEMSLSVKRYLRVVEGKTARLLKLSFEMGAVYANVPLDQRRKLLGAVHGMGMAFQIIDDCLDFSAKASTLGKPILQDLQNGYMTLPAIFHCQRNPDFYKQLIKNNKPFALGKGTKMTAGQFEPDVARALAIAKAYTEKSIALIGQLPDNPMKAPLIELAGLLAARGH